MGYLIASILAIILGQAAKHLCLKLPPVVSEEITYKEYFKTFKEDFKVDYIFTTIYLNLFNLLIFTKGLLPLSIIYMLLIFTLSIVFYIDYKTGLIPDETHIAILVLAMVNLGLNLSNYASYILGLLAGGGIFYILGLLALLIYKKEGMGFGDVKLMASLGLLFGLKTILVISLLAFGVGAIISILLIATKKKQMDSYIPFGPFIVIGSLLVIYFSPDVFIFGYLAMCNWLGTTASNILFEIIGKY